MLCILSPICLILLAGMSEVSRFGISEDAAAGVGLCVLLVLVAVGVAIFLACAAKAKPYEFLEKEPFETEYGVAGMVRERRKEYAPAYARLNITGTVLRILAAVPLFAAMCVSASGLFYIGAVCLLLAIVSVGCFAFVLGGVNHSAMQALLEERTTPVRTRPRAPSSARSAASTGCSSPPFTSSTPSAPWATDSRNTAGSSGRSRACSSVRSCWW